MAAVTEERRLIIKDIVCDVLEIDPEELTDSSYFKDHGADSLRAIEILAGLEKKFSLTIDQGELSRMVNLEGIFEVIADASN
ncbi:acyl carrier protein [Kitasatospora sp. P5_F3]